jgi:hypothetical protein
VTLPQAALWQRLRQRALDAIPMGSTVDFRAPLTLGTWQAQGTYTISAASTSKFRISVQPQDFGGALLSDASFHLDHALEHQTSLMKVLQAGVWGSPAWQLVTFYYWAYFSAMALTRMLGHTVWFVTSDVARQFTVLAPAGSASVTQGTYELICDQPLSAGIREVRLSKRPRRLHEQLWITLFGLLRETYRQVGAGVTMQREERLFLAMLNSARMLGDDWPSALRNVVNYRPGFAYTAPRFRPGIEAFSYLVDRPQTIDGLIDRLENNSFAMSREPSVLAQPTTGAKMLVDLAILLSRMAQALHDELVDRDRIDRRWLNSKNRFAHQQGLLTTGAPWPC